MTPQPLDPKRERLALALARGASVRRAAADAKIPTTTARRWASEPAVRRRAAELREDVVGRAVGVLARLSTRAATTLGKLLDSPDDETRLKAARAILADLLAVRESTEALARLAELEERINGNQSIPGFARKA